MSQGRLKRCVSRVSNSIKKRNKWYVDRSCDWLNASLERKENHVSKTLLKAAKLCWPWRLIHATEKKPCTIFMLPTLLSHNSDSHIFALFCADALLVLRHTDSIARITTHSVQLLHQRHLNSNQNRWLCLQNEDYYLKKNLKENVNKNLS